MAPAALNASGPAVLPAGLIGQSDSMRDAAQQLLAPLPDAGTKLTTQ